MAADEIDLFANYLETGAVRKGDPDPGQATGLMAMARSDMTRVTEEQLTAERASYVFKNAYDVVRAAITAHMALDGYTPYSHTAVVAYARDELGWAAGRVARLNKFRKLRNNIKYRAEQATVGEAEDIIDFMETVVPVLAERLDSAMEE